MLITAANACCLSLPYSLSIDRVGSSNNIYADLLPMLGDLGDEDDVRAHLPFHLSQGVLLAPMFLSCLPRQRMSCRRRAGSTHNHTCLSTRRVHVVVVLLAASLIPSHPNKKPMLVGKCAGDRPNVNSICLAQAYAHAMSTAAECLQTLTLVLSLSLLLSQCVTARYGRCTHSFGFFIFRSHLVGDLSPGVVSHQLARRRLWIYISMRRHGGFLNCLPSLQWSV